MASVLQVAGVPAILAAFLVFAAGLRSFAWAVTIAISVIFVGSSTWGLGAAVGVIAVLALRRVRVAPLGRTGRRLATLSVIFLILGYLSWLANGFPEESVGAWLAPMTTRVVFACAIMKIADRKSVDSAVIHGLLLGGAVEGAVGIAQSFGYMITVSRVAWLALGVSQPRVTGTGTDPNYYALDLAIVCAFALAYRRARPSILLLASLFLCCVGIVLSLSRTGVVALAAGLIVALGLGLRGTDRMARRRAVIPIAVATVAVFAVGPSTLITRLEQIGGSTRVSTVQQRIDLWNAAGQVIEQHPFWGVGPDQTRFAMLSLEGDMLPQAGISGQPLSAHNTLLDVSGDIGLPGLVVWLILILATLRAALARRRDVAATKAAIGLGVAAAVVAFFVGSLFVTADLSFAFWVSVALAAGGSEQEASAKTVGAAKASWTPQAVNSGRG